MRPTDLFPKMLVEELVRLHRLNPDWMEVYADPDSQTHFGCRFRVKTALIGEVAYTAQEKAGSLAISRWVGGGPKVFIPTPQQCRAMEQVEVNLTSAEFTSPYEAMAVKLPDGMYPPYRAVIVFKHPASGHLILSCHSVTMLDDIVSVTRGDSPKSLDSFLCSFEEECRNTAPQAAMAMRVSTNLCLALANFGSRMEYMYPAEVASDKSLAREKSERGERARRRIPLAVQRVSFSQEVQLHRTETTARGEYATTGASMPPHWRRGHWAMQVHGKGRAERKRIFRAPVLVRSDLAIGGSDQTSVVYRG
jgi:hypothetical protein